ncbi:MAG: hypothetical protein IJ819_08810 [Clostridiales bacterium]|nr:hypothetical protein [Clostridiales bacterium]
MNKVYNDAFWKAVSHTASYHGIIEASVVVYCRVYGMTVNECCSAVGLGAKHVKAVLSEFDRYSATVIPVVETGKLSA